MGRPSARQGCGLAHEAAHAVSLRQQRAHQVRRRSAHWPRWTSGSHTAHLSAVYRPMSFCTAVTSGDKVSQLRPSSAAGGDAGCHSGDTRCGRLRCRAAAPVRAQSRPHPQPASRQRRCRCWLRICAAPVFAGPINSQLSRPTRPAARWAAFRHSRSPARPGWHPRHARCAPRAPQNGPQN